MNIKFKIWLEHKNKYVIGEGSYALLKKINELQNLKAASDSLHMSYRYAWGVVKKIENAFGQKVVIGERGGIGRGKSTLTEQGLKLIAEYEKYLAIFTYYSSLPYKLPAIAVDGILIINDRIVFIKRKNEPFKGQFALPGGFVEYGETLESAIIREVFEETGMHSKIVRLLNIYSDPTRDPREHVISAVYVLKPLSGSLKAGDDAGSVKLLSKKQVPKLAFDHTRILNDFFAQS
jgi:8-oxo-dGTP diphosphatase